MKFPTLSDGDKVVLEQTDCRRGYFDMGANPIAVVTVTGVTEKSFIVNGKRFCRRNGSIVGPSFRCNLSVRPYVEGVEKQIAAFKSGKQWDPIAKQVKA